MNKKVLIGVLIAILVIVLAIVGIVIVRQNTNEENNEPDDINDSENDIMLIDENNQEETISSENEVEEKQMTTSSGNKILIAYFSETGNTDKFANIIHDQIGGDLFKIEPVVAYPTGQELFDYTKEEQDNDERPEIKGTVNINDYDTIFIGYPIWWYEVPQIIKTFLDQYDLSGKKVIPFNTHEGSGDGGTYNYIKEQEPNADVLKGLPIRGGNMSSDQTGTISNWLKGLGF